MPEVLDRVLMFCATPRCGSTMIVNDLRAVAGFHDGPHSNAEGLEAFLVRETRFSDWDETWSAIRASNRTQGVVVQKVMHGTASKVSAILAESAAETRPLEAFRQCFRDAIWVSLEREDICAQAVSLWFARTTQFWHMRRRAPGLPPGYGEATRYDREALLAIIGELRAEKAGWRRFFADFAIAPLRIVYEDAVENYPSYLDPLMHLAGFAPLASIAPRPPTKIGGEKALEFAERLRADLPARS